MSTMRKMSHPSTLVMLAANALPLLGITLGHWNAFLLLILYWTDTAIIGFWTIFAVAVSPRSATGKSTEQPSRLLLVAIVVVLSGVFMSLHFMILWHEFSGRWRGLVDGPGDFVWMIVVDTGLWIPMLALFASRGVSFVLHAFHPEIIPAWLWFESKRDAKHPPDDYLFAPGSVFYGLYVRVVVIQFVLLVAGALAIVSGALGPLIFLIALKTAIDLGLHITADLSAEAKPAAVTNA